MASNQRSSLNTPLTQQDGRFPLGADRLRASYLLTIRETVTAIRHNNPCTSDDLASLERQYSSLENLEARFLEAHGNLISLLTDSRFERQEIELFYTTLRDITEAFTILHRAIQTRKRVQNLPSKATEKPIVASIEEPQSELERLIAANAVLKHRLEATNTTGSISIASASKFVLSSTPTVQYGQPSTSGIGPKEKTVIQRRIPPSEKVLEAKRNAQNMKASGNKSGKCTSLRKLLNQKKSPSEAVKHKPASSNKPDAICEYCFEDHKIFRCEEFRKLPLINRADNVERLRLCPICLHHKKENHRCPKGNSECKMCTPLCHNSLLCPKRHGPNAEFRFNNSV